MKNIAIIFSCIFITCCTKMCGDSRSDMTPEQVVERYLQGSMTMEDLTQKEELLDLTTGLLHSAINAANEDTITKAFINKTYKQSEWMIVERRDRTPRETEVTFELKYRDLSNDPNQKIAEAPEVITENTVTVVKEKSIWRIQDVIGKKTSIDFPTAGEVIKPKKEDPEESPEATETPDP